MNIQFGITNITETEFKLNPDFEFEGFDKNLVNFGFRHMLSANKEKGDVSILMSVRLSVGDQQTELVTESVRCTFHLIPFDAVIKHIEEGKIEVTSPELIDTLINVTIGTLRGILYKNLRGTPLNGIILPLIPMTMIQKAARISK